MSTDNSTAMLVDTYAFSSRFLQETDAPDTSPPNAIQAHPNELGWFGSSSVDPPPATGWWYDPARHGDLEAFATSAEFRHFATQFHQHIWVLWNEIAGCREAVMLSKFGVRATTVGPDGVNRAYGDHADLIYRAGAEHLARIVQHVRNGRLPRDTCATALKELATQLNDCASGALNALVTTEGRLGSDRLHLGGKFRTVAERVVEQIAIEGIDLHYAKELRSAPGSHRHLVAGLQRVLKQEAGMAWRSAPDRCAPEASQLPSSLVAECRQRLLQQCHPDRVVHLMAEEYLSRFQQAMRDEDTAAGALTADALGEHVHRCTATLKPEFGEPPPLEALLQERGDTGVYEPKTDVAGIKRHFLCRLREAGLICGAPMTWAQMRALHVGIRPLDLRLMTAGSPS